MSIMKFKRHGAVIAVTFHEPTTQEHNEFANEMARLLRKLGPDGSDEGIISYHAAMFDRWADEVAGCDKAQLTDRQKSVMLTQFMSIEVVDEKN